MELKALDPKLGRWLSIEELKGLFAELPYEICQRIPMNQKLLNLASEFVEEKGGRWEHQDWESFLERLGRERFIISDEVKAPIGNILEIFKKYYNSNKFGTIREKRGEPLILGTVAPKQAAPAKGSRHY